MKNVVYVPALAVGSASWSNNVIMGEVTEDRARLLEFQYGPQDQQRFWCAGDKRRQ